MYSRFRTAVTVSHLTELDRRSWHLNLMKNSLNTVCYHLNVESKKAKLIETENRLVVVRGRREKNWEMFVKGYNLPLTK